MATITFRFVVASFALARALGAGAIALATAAPALADDYEPWRWTNFVQVEGQPLPVPAEWLHGDEARIAHGLKLPESVPKPVPFDFRRASWRAWLPDVPRVAVQYFDHLCSTEAGEWIFRKVENVEGLYFARPQGPPSTQTLTEAYAPEMPWIQRIFLLTGESLHWQGTWFVQPPNYNYRYVEQPRRPVPWQTGIPEPYVRLFGYTRERLPVPGVHGVAPDPRYWYSYRDQDPMRVIGVSQLAARYGYTWRGLRRERDREHGIAGGEVLIYDLHTKEVLAVRRQFLIAGRNPRGPGAAMWEVAARCPQIRTADAVGSEFSQFAFDVLQTVEPSTTVRR